MARIKARELAFKLVFEDLFGVHTAKEMFGGLFEEEKEFKAINDADIEYIEWIRKNVAEHDGEINEIISQKAIGWTVERMDKVDLAILRVALCEILYREDVTSATAINEAVELAKVYSQDTSPAFINGILGAYVKEL